MNREIKEGVQSVLIKARKSLKLEEIIENIPEYISELDDSKTKERVWRLLICEVQKPDGLFICSNGKYDLLKRVDLRERVKNELESNGFGFSYGQIIRPKLKNKEDIRRFHAPARADKYGENKDFLEKNEEKLLTFFANGDEINIEEFWPKLEVVEANTLQSDIFKYATLLWSVPVSQGFGRRVRFLVWDEYTGKLVGIFALGDPVFNLGCRDRWIGWDHEDRSERLYNVMDVFVLGSVPPYNTLLGGKLVAMLATSGHVQEIIRCRYEGKKTVIQGKNKDPRLALLTTSSALGKSSIYDRIRYNDRVLYQRIGESEGWGHFHLNHGLFGALRFYLEEVKEGKVLGNRFGEGPNWKIRTAKAALSQIGLPGNILKHGIKREVYGIPLACNFKDFLMGKETNLESFDLAFDDLASYWKERWLKGRAKKKPEFIKHKKERVSEIIHSAVMNKEGSIDE
ncbi:hypothetical protein C5S32_03655 [ANME-1 cluster archaeon GoMg1]|nr:hypothetical protein [ANME-1 cluster archaeon GoMg1]